jgi:hypothetical protein
MAEDDTIPPKETQTAFQRDDKLVLGSRTGLDRRDDDRGLAVGRRLSEQQEVRRSFIDRIVEMSREGGSPTVIAGFLNEEGLKTARGEYWTEAAISQLLATEEARKDREAWRPSALDDSADPE